MRHLLRHAAWWAALVSLVLTCALAARAEHTHRWRQSTYEDFLKGAAHGIAVSSDGHLELAPRFHLIADADASYLWSVRVDAKGILYAAGGSPARVFRFDANGKPVTIFESTELSAQALALDPKGTLYVATSPDGKVHRVSPDGNIYAAAIGEKPRPGAPAAPQIVISPPGATAAVTVVAPAIPQPAVQGAVPFVPLPPLNGSSIYRVAPDGAPEELWSAREDVVYSLGLAPDGRLLAGTGNSGTVLAIDGRGVFAQLDKSGSAQITGIARNTTVTITLR